MLINDSRGAKGLAFYSFGTVASGGITPNLTQYGAFSVTLAGGVGLSEPVGMPVSSAAVLYVTQDATGGRVLTFDPAYRVDPGAALSTAPGAEDTLLLERLPSGAVAVSIHNAISPVFDGVSSTGLVAFTPTIASATAGDVAFGAGTISGKYEKIGSRVFFSIKLDAVVNWTTGSASLFIGGLPLANAGLDAAVLVAQYEVLLSDGVTYQAWPGSATQMNAKVLAGESRVRLYGSKSGATQSPTNLSNVPNGATLRLSLSGTYPA